MKNAKIKGKTAVKDLLTILFSCILLQKRKNFLRAYASCLGCFPFFAKAIKKRNENKFYGKSLLKIPSKNYNTFINCISFKKKKLNQ